MKRPLWIGMATLVLSAVLEAQDISGDWRGTLKAGPAELRLVLHVEKEGNGALQATLDSVDQGANGIPVTSIVLENATLKLTLDAIKGSYEGKVNAAATSIVGTWTQGQSLPLTFLRGTVKTTAKPAKPSDIDGAWSGTVDFGNKLRLVFHITNTEDGLTATLDSLDQGANGIPVTTVTRDLSSLKLEMKQLAAVFEGKIATDLKTIAGTFTQNGSTVSLVLSRAK